jgi:hypothetical protein
MDSLDISRVGGSGTFYGQNGGAPKKLNGRREKKHIDSSWANDFRKQVLLTTKILKV